MIRRLLTTLLTLAESPSRLRFAEAHLAYTKARLREVTAERNRWRAQVTALRLEVEQLREGACE